MPTKNNNHTESRACTCRHNLIYILPLLSIGSKINFYCVFLNMFLMIQLANIILLQKAITKSTIFVGNSFFIKGNSAVVMDKGGKFLKKLWCCIGGRV